MNSMPQPSCCSASRLSGEIRKDEVLPRGSDRNTVNMKNISGGTFLMGTDDKEGFPADGEGPVREITVDPFYIDSSTVTNEDFKKFIEVVHYETEAERFGWSFVFYGLLSDAMRDTHPQVSAQTPWWCAIPGATWDHPEG
ncbi:MAG: SUMF1/EgtB/PvdO family nonheme iron enzyme, partial [Chitinophagaceae bacterium]